MILIYKKLGILLVTFGVIYIFLMAASYIFYPTKKYIDTGAPPPSLWGPEVGQVVKQRGLLSGKAKRIILVGSSNVREGFRPLEIIKQLNGWDIHNIAIGASNITQLKQIVESAYEFLPLNDKGETIFVIGCFFGSFVDNNTRWKGAETDYGSELRRYGLYKKINDYQYICNIPLTLFPSFLFALRPFLALNYPIETIEHFLKNLSLNIFKNFSKRKKPTAGSSLNRVKITEDYKNFAIKFWESYMGGDNAFQEEQFLELQALQKMILSRGDKFVLVDLPLPQWHMDKSKYYALYKKISKNKFDELSRHARSYYIDMSLLNSDDDFYDSAHPYAAVSGKWGSFLSSKLNKIINN